MSNTDTITPPEQIPDSLTSQPEHRPDKGCIKRPSSEQKWKAREDYIKGRGSLRVIRAKHNLAWGTLRDWAMHENWAGLRATFEQAALNKLVRLTEPAKPEPLQQPAAAGTQAEKLRQVEQQLKDIDEALKECSTKELAVLWKAKSMALDAWSLLTGFPKPGTRKQGKTRSSTPDIQPIGVSEPSSSDTSTSA